MKNNDSNDKNNKLLRTSFINLILKIMGWTLGIIFLYSLAFDLIESLDFMWLYRFNPQIYYVMRDMFHKIYNNEFMLLLLVFIWLSGILYILYTLIKKYNSLIVSLSNSASKLFDKNVEFIALPKELEEFQIKLNHLKRESEKNEKIALEQEQKKNDLIVYLAHDLKTPLTSIIGYLSLLDEIKDMPEEKREKYITTALDKAYRLEDLINELFDIARFNSEKIILEKEELNLNLMLEQLREEFYPLLNEKQKELKINVKDKIILNGDADKLARVFSNLIKNAIFYSTDKLITINAYKNKNNVEITIANKGKVIPPEKLKKIFEKFYRADSSRTTISGGSGLGLAIAKEIVELHKGSIEATSDTSYTKFYVTLPLE